MNMENLLISIDEKDLVLIREITLDELKTCLHDLIQSNQVEEKLENGEAFYMRRGPKMGLLRKIKSFLK